MHGFHEARSESIPGQYAVALVTMNRAGEKSRVCAEVSKPQQFSWANGRAWRIGQKWVIDPVMTPRDADAWNTAKHIAAWTLKGKMADFTEGATHYHAFRVRPAWRRDLERVKDIGGHRFYRAKQSVLTASL